MKNQDPQPHDEAVTISLEDFRRNQTLPDDKPPEPSKDSDDPQVDKTDEAFWAGRTLAMRRSARWAA